MLNINQLFELNDLARKDAEGYPKKWGLFNSLTSEKGKHFTGIVGPRGVGKTV
jgi:ABC-type cobalamin/Fe3+-siderophores transport system ATPase subunit